MQASRLLLDNLKDSMTVALSWGHALQAMVYATTSDQEHHRLTLVQLVGGLSSISNEISGQELVRELAVRLGAGYRFLHAPATLEPATSRDALLGRAVDRRGTEDGPAGRHRVRRHRYARPRLVGGDPRLAQPRPTTETAGVLGQHARSVTSPPATTTPTGQPIHGAVDDRVLGVTLDGPGRDPARRRRGARPRQGPRRPRCPARPPHRLPGVRRGPRPHLLSEARSASASDNGGA